jgi:arylsulfatase A-like enzyme
MLKVYLSSLLTFLIILFQAEPVKAVKSDHSKPNIILCMADDLGWGDTGYNGHPVLRTPYLDQMAREGIRFDRFNSAAPVCSPTRGSVLTGRHPYRYGIYFANSGKISIMSNPSGTQNEHSCLLLLNLLPEG